MNNWMPPPRYDAVDSMEELGFDLKTNYNRFDLKGCADDKTLVALGRTGPRRPQAHLQRRHVVRRRACGLTKENATSRARSTRERSSSTCLKLRTTRSASRRKRDVQFLQKWGLMDYSLVVSLSMVSQGPI